MRIWTLIIFLALLFESSLLISNNISLIETQNSTTENREILDFTNKNGINSVNKQKTYQFQEGLSKRSFQKSFTTNVEHDTIYISGNSDFISQANEEGWTGDGTESNPYIIDSYEITGTGSGILIDIRSTDLYFHVRNCYTVNGFYGIYLYDVINGDISSNQVMNCEEAISLSNCQDNRITGNLVSNNTYGISLYYSGNNVISSNTIIAGGLFFYGEEMSDFVQTEVADNTVNGKPIVYWQDIIGGTVPSGAGQVILVNCTSVEVTNQNFIGFSVGLVAAFSSRLDIHNNTITNNIRGIYIRLSKNNTVFNNMFDNNDRGLFLSEARYNSVLNNTFVNDGFYVFGEKLEDVLQTEVSGNTVNGKPLIYWQNVIGGIISDGTEQVILVNCTSIEITNLTLVDTSVCLIAGFCSNLNIHNNTMANAFWGIFLYYSDENTLTNNSVSNCSADLIYIYSSNDNSFTFNRFLDDPGGSFTIYEESSNNIFACNFWSVRTSPDNDGDGIVDFPYSLPGSSISDHYPLVAPDVHVLLPINQVFLNGTTTIQWAASADSFKHNITYSVFFSLDDGVTWMPLASNLTMTMYKWDTFDSDTQGFEYLIKVQAICSEGGTSEVTFDSAATSTTSFPQTTTGIIPKTSAEPFFDFSSILLLFLIPVIVMIGMFSFLAMRGKKDRKPYMDRYSEIRSDELRLSDHSVCHNCRALLKENSLFCAQCGAKQVRTRKEHIDYSQDPFEVEKETLVKPIASEKVSSYKPIVTTEPKPYVQTTTEAIPAKIVSEDIKSLFSTIHYQVQELIYEEGKIGPIVRIIPYSGSIKEFTVILDQNKVIMNGCLKRQDLPKVNLALKIEGKPREPSWDDPWEDVKLIGEKKVIKRLELRREIATRLYSLGTASVDVKSPIKGEICITVKCNETKEDIKLSYSLMKDLQSFFEISLY